MTTETKTVEAVLPALSSIRNRAVLVSIGFSKPQMSAQDKRAQQAAADDARGSAEAYETKRKLYPKHLIAPITAVESEMRNFAKARASMTLVDGMYLINSHFMMEVLPVLNEFELRRRQAVTVFAQNWSNVIAEAQQAQGDAFDPSVYPDVSEVVDQFQTHLKVIPVGDLGGGLFDDIESELRSELTARVADTTRSMMAETIAGPLAQLIECVANMYDKTSRDDSRMHESVVANLREISERVPQLNLLGLPQLNQLAEHCRTAFDVPVEGLARKGSAVREKAAKDSEEILRACNVDPESTQKLTGTERRALASKAADDILAQMSGLF